MPETPSFDTYHKDHWVDIEPDRFARYEKLFRLDEERADAVLGRVGVQAGETVVDFGCGPGFVAAQLARLVGPDGHVHAVDVNEDMVAKAVEVAEASGRGGWITAHHSPDEHLPLPDGTADRVYAKNVLEYVPDLDGVLAELARLLRPGGTMVASDSDFGFVVVEPLTPAEVTEVFDAAAPAFREPNVGRKLRAAFLRAGYDDVEVSVAAAVDTSGRFAAVVENMLGYGLAFDRIEEARAAELLGRVTEAVEDGTFLSVLPQWWVTGTRTS